MYIETQRHRGGDDRVICSFFLPFSLMFPNVYLSLASPKILSFRKNSKLICFFAHLIVSLASLKIGCIQEKTKQVLVFPFICTIFGFAEDTFIRK